MAQKLAQQRAKLNFLHQWQPPLGGGAQPSSVIQNTSLSLAPVTYGPFPYKLFHPKKTDMYLM